MSTPVRRAIYGKLAGDSGGLFDPAAPMLATPAATGYTQSIYHEQAPADAGFPFIVLSKSSGTVTETFGDYTNTNPVLSKDPRVPGVLNSDLWLVKAIVRGDDVLTDQLSQSESPSDRADRIAARIQFLLNDGLVAGSPGPVAGSAVLSLRRESDVEYAELAEGVVYRHSGALYRLITTNP